MNKTSALILLSISIIFGCDNDDSIQNIYGTRIISIEHRQEDENWFENYTYTPNGKLNQVEDYHALGRRYEIAYADDRIVEFKTFRMDENSLIFRDSILYNPNGSMQAIYNFSINSGEDLPLTWIYEFEYDNLNRLSKKATYFVNIQEYTSIENFYWSGNNIERTEYYNGDEELYYEYFYTYDDKKNYKKGLPMHLSYPVNWSENNITEMKWKDYVGNLDLICSPCITEYKYNLDNYPVLIKYNWGKELILTYE